VIARGDAEIYVNTSDKTSEWDTCAPEIILTEAGGKITDMEGNELDYNKENSKHLNGFISINKKIIKN
jgi:3'(2'), 5'-bisphosphate nucleotidase